MELYQGQLRNADFKIYERKSKFFSNAICTFDIETTSAWIENGSIIPYSRYRKNADGSPFDWNSLEATSLCYIWQFSIEEKVYYGRTLESFLDVLNDIPYRVKTTIWVHNLAFEFQFLLNILFFKKVFARAPHKVMKAIPEGFENIEFRCSYFLTRLSLSNWGFKIGVHKKSGDLDYSKIRTPLTPVTDTEMGYCEYDCLVMYHGLKEYREKYDTIDNIPLTQTGTVRRVIKNLLTDDYNYLSFVKRLVPKDANEYYMLQQLFAGGYAHANRLHSGIVKMGLIEHYDFRSSYPYVMVTEKFPCNPWSRCLDNVIPDDSSFEEYGYIFKLRFTKIECITFNTYLQSAKSHIKIVDKKPIFDNGRVVSADILEITVTEQDYLTIRDTYQWEKMEVIEAYKSRKQYLDRRFILYILELYGNKTSLKDVEGYEALYAQSKEYINALFGMMVTAIMQADVLFQDDSWDVAKLTENDINQKLQKLAEFGMHENRYFLSYSWGIYVTAYARRNLWTCIIKNDENNIYSDTDSLFLLGKNDFSWYNEIVVQKIRNSSLANNIPFELFEPKTKKGIKKMIGIFDKEEDCTEFLTLGAKRYVERRSKDNKLRLTVSGINKEAVALLDDDIENFADGFIFDKDSEYVRKKILIYMSSQKEVIYPDGYVSKYPFGIALRNNGYKLTITDEYKDLIDYVNYSPSLQKEEIQTRQRGVFIPSNLVN